MKKIGVIIIFFICSIFSLANSGIGDLDITVDLKPAYGTKKYYMDRSILLDVGDINSKSIEIKKKIADVTVIMKTKESTNGTGNDYCVIDGDFNVPYHLDKVSNLNNQKIQTSELTRYYKGNNIQIELYQDNFKLIHKSVLNEVGMEHTYSFSAYPEKCVTEGNGQNIIRELSYSFEIWIDIKNAGVGDIVRTDVSIKGTPSTEDAIGAIKDLVKEQFRTLQ